MEGIAPIFYIVVLLMSVVIHEVSHGYAALYFGDRTAELQGRLTLNPLKHLDLYGSIILPLLLLISQAPFLIGWAKPVPYNPNNFTQEKRRIASIWVASAGILSNLLIVLFFGILIRLTSFLGINLPESVISISSIIVFVNIVLAVFNLMPFPPLDGSKILFGFLGYRYRKIESFMEKYSIVFLIIFIFFIWKFITPIIYLIFNFATGLTF